MEWGRDLGEKMGFKDIFYHKAEGIAKVTINRPQSMNAFTGFTQYEMSQAFSDAWSDKGVGAVVLTGAGNRAFCTGGDVKARSPEGGYLGPKEHYTAPHDMIVTMPKVVIAMVNGFAIGGGNVLALICDLSVASETAAFGQVGPRFGSFDPSAALLARLVGVKKAKELWFLCRRYTAQQALEMGLVNWVVPADKLEEETVKVCKEVMGLGPYAIKVLKSAFNGDLATLTGMESIAHHALELYYGSEEALEGSKAFIEKRAPDFSKWR